MMTGDTSLYERAFFRLSYPSGWTVRENPMGLTEFCPTGQEDTSAGQEVDPYPPGVALITIPETGVALEPLLRTGLYFITRDLRTPAIERLGEEIEGDLAWYRLLVHGRTLAPGPDGLPLEIVKRVAVGRPGPGVLVLALYGTADAIEPLESTFETVRRSVQILR